MRQAKNLHRVHSVRVHEHRLSVRFLKLFQVRLDNVKRARFSAALRHVNEDRHVVTVHQRVSQIEAADAIIHTPRFTGQFTSHQSLRHLDAEAVVAEKDVADAGDQNTRMSPASAPSNSPANSPGSSGSTSSGEKKKR